MANIKGKQLTDSLSVTNVTGSNVSASGLIIGNSGSLQHIDVDNNAVVDGDLKVSQYIKHIGNETTFINFTSNRIRFKAGDIGFADMEKDASTPYPFTINQGGNRINFRVMDRNTDLLLKTDSEAFNVGLYHAGNKKLETTSAGIDVSNINVSASGHITASGDISSSANITGNILNVNTRVKAIGSSLEFAGNTLDFVDGSSAGRLFKGTAGGSFEAYYNGQKKIETTAGGILVGSGSISGNITASGDISSSATGSFGELEIGNGGDIVLTEDQRIYFEADKNTYIETHAADSFRIVVNNRQMFLFDEDTGNRAVFGNGTKVFIGENNNFTPLASLHIAGNLWVSGSDAQGGAHITASGNISASGDVTANEFNGIFIGALSSSAQISTDISGSFVAPSASFSTRITTAESELGNTLISSSAQISDDISGSLSAAAIVGLGAGIVSGSIDGTISSSAQIASDISGSFNKGFEFTGKISGSSTSTGSFGLIESDGDLNISGRLAHAGDPDTRILFTDDDINITVGDKNFVDFTEDTVSEVTFNEEGVDIDFRIETDNDSKALYINAGDDTIQLGSSANTHVTASGNISGSAGNILGFASASFSNVDAPHIKATSIHGTILTATQGTIDHDSLSGFVANEHINHTSVTMTAGAGLTGGGDISSTRTLAVGQGTGVTVNANDVAIGQDVGTDQDVEFASITTTGNITAQGDVIAENYIVSSSVTYMTSSAISGSSIFGDTQDDTHQFTGSVFVSGSTFNIDENGSVSSSASGSFLNVKVSDNLGVTGKFTLPNITDVSASIAAAVAGGDDMGNHTATQDLDMDGNDIFDIQHISSSGNISGSLGEILGYNKLSVVSSGSFGTNLGVGTTTPAESLEVIGAISASTSGSFLNLDVDKNINTTNLYGTILTATQATIDHDSLANFVANEHIDHSSVSVTAGDGLTGGGTIASTRTINVVGGDGITANANDVAITAAQTTIESIYKEDLVIGEDNQTQIDFETANEIHFDVNNSELLNLTGAKISGSQASTGSFGSLVTDANVGIGESNPSVPLEVIGSVSSSASGSFLNVKASNNVNATNLYGTVLTATQGTIDHDSLANFVANEHVDHSGVTLTAGDGLTGGGTIASNRTFAVGQGTGVTVNANDVAIGQAVETDSNVQFANIIATATASLAKISGSLIESTGDFTLNSSGDIILDADGTDVILKDGGTSFGSFKRASSDFIIKAETADKDILFKGTDDSTTITALTLDMSEGGNAQFLGNISGSQIEASGDIIAFGSSDRNLKDNIQPIENPLEKMDKIGGYTFVWNDNQSTYKGKDIGVVAQEIQEILPEIVATRANGYLGVKYEKIVPLLIESIKELKKEVEDIKQKCDCLNK